ncbi:MAG: hypothetical protein ACP5NE_00745 [Candidatus Micrarchaeia archaeon]
MGFASIFLAIIVAFITLTIPGELFAFALLKKTKLQLFEIATIGFIFGLIATPTLTWLESYLINYVHAFSFSLGLFNANALLLTIIGAALCYQQGVFADFGIGARNRKASVLSEVSHAENEYRARLAETREKLRGFESAREIILKHTEEEKVLGEKQKNELESRQGISPQELEELKRMHEEELRKLIEGHEKEEASLLASLEGASAQHTASTKYNMKLVWSVLTIIMLLAFFMRIVNIGVSPHFFEFDPYFDMMSTHSILTLGYQYLLDPSAWPIVAAGTSHRIQPLIPYLEAYWYDLANALVAHNSAFSTSLMSYTASFYPPIVAALLAFAIFMLLYHEYNPYIGLLGASFTATMPTLVSTFIAGEQLLEPWGIFTLFFFFATYMLAVKNMKSTRLAILAGIAFASTFLGAHYYTVDTGVLIIYILLQGSIDYIKGTLNRDFFKMNAIVIIVIALFLVTYTPYHATLSGKIPRVLGVPLTVSGPTIALLFVALLYYGFRELHKRKFVFQHNDFTNRFGWWLVLMVLAIIAIAVTPLGNAVRSYLNLSAKFTTPSSALFMTVAEFEPSGISFNFGANGFGILSPQIGGMPLLLWFVIATFLYIIPIIEILKSKAFSNNRIMLLIALILAPISINFVYNERKVWIWYLAIALPLMIAGFLEVKYLPHFGVAYILMFCIVLGELLFISGNKFGSSKFESNEQTEEAQITEQRLGSNRNVTTIIYTIGLFFLSSIVALGYVLYKAYRSKSSDNRLLYALALLIIIAILAVLVLRHSFLFGESASIFSSLVSAIYYYGAPTASAGCNAIAASGFNVGYGMFCNTVPGYWLSAAAWMRSNVGPYGPRILSWWDYGDWINWFGNSNAVLRGDNAEPKEDYATAASFVLGPKDGYNVSRLANMMNTNETKYVLFSQGLVSKWQALDFLACVDINATSEAYAKAQAVGTGAPYVLGTSPCEINHDPQFALVPLQALEQVNTSLSMYCSISNATTQYIKTLLVVGQSLSNETVCIKPQSSASTLFNVYSTNGTKLNAYIQGTSYLGVINAQGEPLVEFLMIYTPNGPNDTISNAPSEFYSSNYYKGFFLGNLPGFTQVYPKNATGINFVNGTYPIRIFSLDNFTGSLPPVVQKPSWVHNNFTLP